jgi:arabinan endo-1,5-alpha-L-arabinosidase
LGKSGCKQSPFLIFAWLALLLSASPVLGQALEFQGDYYGVHDPAMLQEGDKYYLFSTGQGIQIRCSDDMLTWDLCKAVFFGFPKWIKQEVPAVADLWAPDISFYNGRYQVYYSASSFGSNDSAIGLATNVTLDINSPDYKWQDEGMVIRSQRGFNWNAIDPNFVLDKDGEPWLVFGSFWSGIKLIKLDKETAKRSEEDAGLYSIASRLAPGAVEAPFIIYHEPYYYLFVSFDQCCRGVESTYNIRFGRAETITGPYLDKDGLAMEYGGGTPLKEGDERWRGPGHNAIFSKDGQDFLVYHAYDANDHGIPKLRMEPLVWQDGWPVLAQ